MPRFIFRSLIFSLSIFIEELQKTCNKTSFSHSFRSALMDIVCIAIGERDMNPCIVVHLSRMHRIWRDKYSILNYLWQVSRRGTHVCVLHRYLQSWTSNKPWIRRYGIWLRHWCRHRGAHAWDRYLHIMGE